MGAFIEPALQEQIFSKSYFIIIMISLQKSIILLAIIFATSALNDKRNAIAQRMNVNLEDNIYLPDGVEKTFSFTQTYKKVVPSVPKIAIVSIDQLQVTIPDQSVQFMFSTEKCLKNQIQVAVTSSKARRIQKLALRYLILFDHDNQTWISAPNLVFGSGTETPMQNISSNNSYSNTTIAQVNLTGGVETFYFISGLNVSSTSDNFDIELNVTQINSNTTLIEIISDSQNQTWVNSLCYSWLTYNKEMVRQKIGRFRVVPIVGATEINMKAPLDMITGFNSLQVKNSDQISITVTVDSININADQLDTLTNAKIKGFITKTYDCNQKLYFQDDDKCHVSCPPKTYDNSTDGTCRSCKQDCLTCQNLTSEFCVSCNGTEFRVLEVKQPEKEVGFCVPMSGYFQNNRTEVELCSSQCRTCEGVRDNCTSCNRGMQLDDEGACVLSKGFIAKAVISVSVGALIAAGVVVLLFRKCMRNANSVQNEEEESQQKDEKSKKEKDGILVGQNESKKEVRVSANEIAQSQIIITSMNKVSQPELKQKKDVKKSTQQECSRQNLF